MNQKRSKDAYLAMLRKRNLAPTTLRYYKNAGLRYKGIALLTTGVPIGNVLLSIASPFFASRILAKLITNQDLVWIDFSWFVGLTLFAFILNKIGIRASMRLQAKVMGDLYQKVFDHLLSRSVGFFNNSVGGKLIADTQAFCSSYGLIFNAAYFTILGFTLSTVIGLVIISLSVPLLGLIIFVVLAGLFWWSYMEMKLRGDIRLRRIKVKKALTSHLSDSIVNAVTIKIFGRENHEKQENMKLTDKLTEVQVRDWTRTVGNETNRMGVILVIQAAVLMGLIILSRDNTAIVATGIFAYTYTISILNRFFAVNQSIRQVDDALLDAEPITRILEESAEVVDSESANTLNVKSGHIDLTNVSFRYSDADKLD